MQDQLTTLISTRSFTIIKLLHTCDNCIEKSIVYLLVIIPPFNNNACIHGGEPIASSISDVRRCFVINGELTTYLIMVCMQNLLQSGI